MRVFLWGHRADRADLLDAKTQLNLACFRVDDRPFAEPPADRLFTKTAAWIAERLYLGVMECDAAVFHFREHAFDDPDAHVALGLALAWDKPIVIWGIAATAFAQLRRGGFDVSYARDLDAVVLALGDLQERERVTRHVWQKPRTTD